MEEGIAINKPPIYIFAVLLAALCACQGGQSDQAQPKNSSGSELIISAAASLTDVTKELAEMYKNYAPDVTLTFTYGSSGMLQTQIEEGAPVDIFISAAKKQMAALEEKNLIYGESKDLLRNRIVLIVPKDSLAGIESFEDCGTDKVGTLALGDPATTPAGQYGQKILMKLGIMDTVNEKLNLGNDVRQVLTWVETGEADCGIVFMTDALSSKLVTVVEEAPEGSHTPAVYPVGIIKASHSKETAQEFINFLYSDEAKAVFEKNGFSCDY